MFDQKITKKDNFKLSKNELIIVTILFIMCGYGFMLCITFGYVVLKTMWYSFDIVLCGFSVIIYGI